MQAGSLRQAFGRVSAVVGVRLPGPLGDSLGSRLGLAVAGSAVTLGLWCVLAPSPFADPLSSAIVGSGLTLLAAIVGGVIGESLLPPVAVAGVLCASAAIGMPAAVTVPCLACLPAVLSPTRVGSLAPLTQLGRISVAAVVGASVLRNTAPGAVAEFLELPGEWAGRALGFESGVDGTVYGVLGIPMLVACVASWGSGWKLRCAALAAIPILAMAGRARESVWPLAMGASAAGGVAVWTFHGCTPPRSRLWSVPGLAVAVWCVALSVDAATAASPPAKSSRIAFILGDQWTGKPQPFPGEHGYQIMGEPSFERFREVLRRAGGEILDVDPGHLQVLETADAIVTINLSGKDMSTVVDAIRGATSRGARLLVLSDHTWMFDQGRPTNALLSGTGIRLAFDSAVAYGHGNAWAHAMEVSREPLFGPHPGGAGIGWCVGASLEVCAPARTLALGSRAFRDAGDPSKPGGLGNLSRDTEEEFGGFSLAAEGRIGAGDVLVFGDTSALQDASVESGHEFASRVAAWLLGARFDPALGNLGRSPEAGTLLCLVAAASPIARVLVLPIAGVVSVADRWAHSRLEESWRIPVTGPVLWFDGRFAPSMETWNRHERRPLAVMRAASRHGYLALPWGRPGLPPAGDVILLQEPQASVAPRDVHRFLAWIADGGTLVVFASAAGGDRLSALSRELGVSWGRPEGRGGLDGGQWNLSPDERPATPPTFREVFALVVGEGTSASPVASVRGTPVAVEGRRGRGRWIIVGDGRMVLAGATDPFFGGDPSTHVTTERLLARALRKSEQ